MAISSRLPVRWECKRFEGVMALGRGQTHVDIVIAWRTNGDGWLGWFRPQNRGRIRCGSMTMLEGRGTIKKLESRRSKIVKVVCPSFGLRKT